MAALDRQLAAPRFRGVRPMGAAEGPLPSIEVLRALEERGLLFEVMAHPDQLLAAAEGWRPTTTSWWSSSMPAGRATDSDEERALWTEGIDALAGLGDNVLCKLSGLAMPLGSMAADVLAPWLEHAIDAFGVDRCMFASNFPVDGMHGTFDELYTSYSAVTAGLDDDARDKLFAANASASTAASEVRQSGCATPSLRRRRRSARHCQSPSNAGSLPALTTDCSSVYSARPSSANSRPMPDCLNPPNGLEMSSMYMLMP